MRTARVKGAGGDCYHCVSRVVDRRFALGDVEKEAFRKLMRKCEAFSGVKILTYALMCNHFHLLVEVPERGEIPDELFLTRVRSLYGRLFTEDLSRQLREARKCDGKMAEEQARRIKDRYAYRMGDLSEFLKTLKQRYTQWHNQRENRRGTLWEERFKSVMVQGEGGALRTVAAYIDLNPVRAGRAADPKDYRFSGYGEALSGNLLARKGLIRVMGFRDQEWAEVRREYRKHLYESGEATDGEKGFSSERVREVLATGGRLPLAQAIRCRVRYFTDGVALGSREYIESVFRSHRGFFSERRATGARPMRWADWGGLCTARALRMAPVSLSG